jgi:magnesium transporter
MIVRDTSYDDGFEWLEVKDPDEAEMAAIAKRFRLHPIAAEDALYPHLRTKIDRYQETWALLLKTARYIDSDEVVELAELMVFVSPTYFITVSSNTVEVLDLARRELERDPDHMAFGPFAALHELLDALVTQYESVVDSVAVDIDQIQSDVFSSDRRNHGERIFKLKREVLEFRQAITPLTAGLDTIHAQPAPIPEPLHAYFRDVAGRARRLADRVQAQDALLSDALHANVAVIGTRQNEDMRKITAWVAIVSVPTMIAGVYGMNFEHMPELEQRWGYPAVLGLMGTACVSLFLLFRRRGWL